jgi:peptide/nickel transport system substrate-binding protein
LVFAAAFLIFIFSFVFISIDFFNKKTVLKPVSGGEYVEGVIGQPSFINPVIAGNNDADRDLVELLFNRLSDLSESQKMSEDGKIWNIRLKENIFWQDNRPITSDDIVFTVKTIQDPDSRSPFFSYWQGISVERISEREFKIALPEPYAFFESTIKELRPIPKHLFENIPAANLRLSDYNLEPIASGPFKFLSFEKDRSGFIKEYRLASSENYSEQKPYLKNFVFKYYQNEDELLKAFNSGAIDGFGGLSPKNLSRININHRVFELRSPKYYAVFLNSTAQPVLKDKNVRLALNYATDKKSLSEKIFKGRALPVSGPLVLGMKGFAPQVYPEENFSLEKAGQILEAGGWRLTEDGVREKKSKKESQRLEFDLAVPRISFLNETAELIKEDWSKIGVKLNLIIRSSSEINEEIIKTRNYEMLVFGNVFSSIDSPDLSSFWHSSERFYPGLNLSLYENKTADVLIESIRRNLNEKSRQRDLAALQSLIVNDLPALFLYSPNYLYVAKPFLGGFDFSITGREFSFSSDRFKNVENWHVKTARVFR